MAGEGNTRSLPAYGAARGGLRRKTKKVEGVRGEMFPSPTLTPVVTPPPPSRPAYRRTPPAVEAPDRVLLPFCDVAVEKKEPPRISNARRTRSSASTSHFPGAGHGPERSSPAWKSGPACVDRPAENHDRLALAQRLQAGGAVLGDPPRGRRQHRTKAIPSARPPGRRAPAWDWRRAKRPPIRQPVCVGCNLPASTASGGACPGEGLHHMVIAWPRVRKPSASGAGVAFERCKREHEDRPAPRGVPRRRWRAAAAARAAAPPAPASGIL